MLRLGPSEPLRPVWVPFRGDRHDLDLREPHRSGADNFTGSSVANAIICGTGNDTINGGDGTDTVSYAGTAGAVTVDLSVTTAQNTGGAGTDTITNAENLTGRQRGPTRSPEPAHPTC